jgi:hypothetical protein
MLKTDLIKTKVMRYKERNNKNQNPPNAMLIALGYFRQLECLVRAQIDIV